MGFEIYFFALFVVSLIIVVSGMLAAFHFGRLKREDPIIGTRKLPDIVDVNEEEVIILPPGKVGVGEEGYGEEEGEAE
jgi:hypothetical protein